MTPAGTPPIVLTIAGSDSGGGAGIQADLKTFQAFRTFGASVITAVTAQNTVGVHAVHPVPLHIVEAQLDAVLSDLRPSAVKTGMLATVELVDAVARHLDAADLPAVVVDPVMVATSGDRLLEAAAERTVRERLLPVASLVTPNVPEAEILSGLPIRDPEDMLAAARAIADAGAGAVLVKGGHMEGEHLVDVLWDGESARTWTREKIRTRSTHGTGCTLSAAIAAGLGSGLGMSEAVDIGLDFVERAIRAAPDLGSGHGPLNHLVTPRSGA